MNEYFKSYSRFRVIFSLVFFRVTKISRLFQDYSARTRRFVLYDSSFNSVSPTGHVNVWCQFWKPLVEISTSGFHRFSKISKFPKCKFLKISKLSTSYWFLALVLVTFFTLRDALNKKKLVPTQLELVQRFIKFNLWARFCRHKISKRFAVAKCQSFEYYWSWPVYAVSSEKCALSFVIGAS